MHLPFESTWTVRAPVARVKDAIRTLAAVVRESEMPAEFRERGILSLEPHFTGPRGDRFELRFFTSHDEASAGLLLHGRVIERGDHVVVRLRVHQSRWIFAPAAVFLAATLWNMFLGADSRMLWAVTLLFGGIALLQHRHVGREDAREVQFVRWRVHQALASLDPGIVSRPTTPGDHASSPVDRDRT